MCIRDRPDTAQAEEKQHEESTIAENVIVSLVLHTLDTLPETLSEPDSRSIRVTYAQVRESSLGSPTIGEVPE